jgi:1-acyl-sn-glycerol-3-phosphate acyltransferase
MWTQILRYLFFLIAVRPIALLAIGLNVRHRERLPQSGPAIIVANHNSHLDAVVLMTLFPQASLRWLHPVAAADYFLRNARLAWFALKIIGIMPFSRNPDTKAGDPLAPIIKALNSRQILIFFPEGTRGEPEHLQEFKSGIAHIAQKFPSAPIIPVFLHGLGKALPRGETLLVPFFCDAFVGESFAWEGDRAKLMDTLTTRMHALQQEGDFAPWD